MNAVIQVNITGRYGVVETAKILGIDRGTLRRHTNAGLIKCIVSRQNGRRRYIGSEIQKYHDNIL